MKIIKQGLGFIGLSGIGWLIDLTIYTILSSLLNIPVNISNMLSSLVGTTFVYITSTRKIFTNNSKINIKIKYLIYIVYQVILILLTSKIILVLQLKLSTVDINLISTYSNILAKILITPFTLLLNFIFMKNLIEKL